MELRFWDDPDTRLPHIYGHGVTEDEVRQVMTQRGLDIAEGDNARAKIGQTLAGRHLKIVYVPDEGGWSAFVVTAYELRGKALRAYRRGKRRKRK